MTLTNRVSVFFLSALALVLIGFSIVLFALAHSFLHQQVHECLDTALNTVASAIEEKPDGLEWEPANRTIVLDFSLLGTEAVWLVADEQGNAVDRSESNGLDRFLAETSPSFTFPFNQQSSTIWETSSWRGGQRWIVSDASQIRVSSPDKALRPEQMRYRSLSVTAGMSLIPVRAALQKLAVTLIATSLCLWLAFFFVGRMVCRRALLPLTTMAEAVDEISADDLSLRLPPVASKDELDQLGRAFNRLFERLQVAFERQNRFASEASHQLRTPLTALLGHIEVALRRERSVQEYQSTLATVQARAMRLSQVVEALLFLARTDAEGRLPSPERLSLSNWLAEHLESWSTHRRAKDLKLIVSDTEPCEINSHPVLLGELIDVLIDNACKYSDAGSSIAIRVVCDKTAANISVEDHGVGIDDLDFMQLFVPFYRSEEARRRGIEGIGLGLSIAKRIAELFGGTLTVSTRFGAGSCFTIRLPVAAGDFCGRTSTVRTASELSQLAGTHSAETGS